MLNGVKLLLSFTLSLNPYLTRISDVLGILNNQNDVKLIIIIVLKLYY